MVLDEEWLMQRRLKSPFQEIHHGPFVCDASDLQASGFLNFEEDRVILEVGLADIRTKSEGR